QRVGAIQVAPRQIFDTRGTAVLVEHDTRDKCPRAHDEPIGARALHAPDVLAAADAMSALGRHRHYADAFAALPDEPPVVGIEMTGEPPQHARERATERC